MPSAVGNLSEAGALLTHTLSKPVVSKLYESNSSLLAGLAENISAFILYMTNGIIRVLAILPILMQSLIF